MVVDGLVMDEAQQARQLIQQRCGSSGDLISTPELRRAMNNGGLPDQLRVGIENLGGINMADVRVHYNAAQPAQLQAHAYAQGGAVHIAPGQEQPLPHEAWHVVQQRQGRVG